jgi:RHS repeat-associated protein
VSAFDGANNTSDPSTGATATATAALPGAVTYTYDLADRLISIAAPSGSTTSFTLDALGRHASQTITGSPVSSYAYLGTTDIVVAISSNSTTTSSAIDALGSRVATSSGATFGYLLGDLHGNQAAAFNAAGTAVSDAFAYDAWGVVVASVTSALPTPWRYQGRMLESAAGTPDLYDFAARSYNPALGTFTSLDSHLGSAQNTALLNGYLYANANPATLVDPDGHGSMSDDVYAYQHQVREMADVAHEYFNVAAENKSSAQAAVASQASVGPRSVHAIDGKPPAQGGPLGMFEVKPGDPKWELHAIYQLAAAQQAEERQYCYNSHACFATGADPSLMQDPSKSYLILGDAGGCAGFMAVFRCALPDMDPAYRPTQMGGFGDAVELLADAEVVNAAGAEAALMRSIPGEALYQETALGLTEANAAEGWYVENDGTTALKGDFSKHGGGVATVDVVQYSSDAQSLLAEAVESGLPTKVAMTKPSMPGGAPYLKMTIQGDNGAIGTYQMQDGVWKVTSYFKPDDPTYFNRQPGHQVQW